MRINELFLLVLINLRQNKFKVFLTSLGIIVGAATIVMVIAIGDGGQQDVAEQFTTLNAGTITVASDGDLSSMMEEMMSGMGSMDMMGGMDMQGGMSSAGGMTSGGGTSSAGGTSSRTNTSSGSSGMSSAGGMSMPGGTTSSAAAASSASSSALETEDLEDILFFVPNITSGAIISSTSTEVLGGDLEDAVTYTIVATQSAYQEISNLTLAVGSFIEDSDEENITRCVVLGYDVAIEIFGDVITAYDSKIELDGRTYVVKGVLNSMGSVVSGVAPDTSIFVPYATAEKYLLDRDAEIEFSILASDASEVDTVMTNIESVLTQSNPNSSFSITDAGATLEAAMESAETLSLLLLAIAVIVFIVGGIGIMNVLFVSVKERTREIGILKALGTKKRDILLLFVIEAAMIGFIGGTFGVLLSFGIMPLMEYTDITVVMSSSAVMLAFAFAVITGTLFGFYPAFLASNLVPIEALNNES